MVTRDERNPSDEEIKAQQRRMLSFLRSQWGRFEAEHDDWISETLQAWLADPGIDCIGQVKAIAREHARKEVRRSRIRAERRADVERATVGGRSAAVRRVRRFFDEDALKTEVYDLCREEYRRAWGKDWEDTKAAVFHRSLRSADIAAVAEEAKAREILESVRRLQRLADLEAPSPAASHLVNVETSALDAPRLWFDASELRRFVARLTWNPAAMVAYGCTRRPPGEAPDSLPSPRWVTKPTDRELSILWVLCGGWPALSQKRLEKGLTARDVLRTVDLAVASARTEAERWGRTAK